MNRQNDPRWIAVEFVFADGSVGPGEATDAGAGWCDCIAPMKEGGIVRFWAKSDGATDPPMNLVRLARPFAEYRQRYLSRIVT